MTLSADTLEALIENYDHRFGGDYYDALLEHLLDHRHTILAALREVEALRADAERYRWLRNFDSDWWKANIVSQLGSLGDVSARLHSDRLDAAIDTARAAEGK